MRRTAAWKPIAGVAAATIAIAGFGVAPATAAPGDPSQALAEVLRTQLVEGTLAGAGLAYASAPGGPGAQTDPLSVALLDGDVEIVSDGLQLPLITDGTTPGLLDLGQAGALSSYASTPTATDAVAASGLLTDDGAIAFDADEEPPTASTASVDLTALLSQLSIDDLTDEIVGDLGLQVGAVASSVEIVDGAPVAQYRVADLGLQVSSELVGTLGTSLREGVDGLTVPLQSTVGGLGSTVTSTLNAINVSVAGLADVSLGGATTSVTLADLDATLDTVLGANAILVSDDESVTVNLTDGTITVDLAQIVNPDGVGLNDFGPNTEVLTPETIQAITSGISNALGSIVAPVTAAVEDLLDDSRVTVTIPVTAALNTGLPLVGTIDVIGGNLVVSGTLSELAAGTGTISNTLAVLPGLPIGSELVTPLLSGLVTGLTDQVANPLLAALNPAVDAVLVSTSDQIEDALQAIVTEVTDALSPVLSAVVDQIASITINAQPTLETPPAPSDLGSAGFTVRALEVTLLPDLAGSSLASIALASSSVQVVEAAAAGSLEIDPDRAHAGDTVDLSGTGWDPAGGDVTVTFVDADGNQVGAPVVIAEIGDAGEIAGAFTVPAGTASGTLTATAEQAGATTDATLEVVDAPVVIVEPDPVEPGETITISGSGFLCGPVTVTISDGATVLETIEDIAVTQPAGTWSTTYVVPADIDATSLTITAVATGECGDEDDTDVEVDQPETIALTPGEVRGGDDVVIDGDGWNPDGGPVTVVFTDADGNPVGDPVAITPNDDGSIDDVFEVPAGTPAGELTGTATQGGDETSDTVAVFDPASVSVDPGSVRAGADVTIAGGGWLPSGGDVTVTFEDADGIQVGGDVVLTPGADGTIAGGFTVPAGTDPGILTAVAVQGDDEATDALVIAAEPSVTVEPDTARPGDLVTVGGAGWTDGTPVAVVFTDADGAQVGDTLSLEPNGGVISGDFTVPTDVEPGTLTATATQGVDEATDDLEVTLAPTVSATPEQLHAGDAITIGGTGWDPASGVTVTVTNADGDTIGTALALTPTAEGVIAGSFTVPAGTDLGILTVTAVQGADDATDTVEVVADPTVVVTPNPADPGQQVTISGDGFLCGPVTVTISAGDTVLATIEGLTVVNGQWSTVYTVPVDVTVDSLTIVAVATGVCGDEGETDLEVDLAETLTATPAFAEIGDVVTVAGTGWADGAVTITATDVSDAVVGTFTATSVEGSFSVPFTVPAGTALGTLEFEATQGDDVETAAVSVVSIPAGPATIIVSPSTVEAGATVAIDGEGFDPTAGLVTITVTNASDGTVGSVVAAVQPDGALFRTAFQVPSTVDPQTLTATAVQGPRTASDTFDVRASNLPVVRLGGPDRFATAVEISRDAFPFGSDVVYLANGLKFPDALSAAPAAAQTDSPLLLTRQEYLEPGVIDEFDRLEPDVVVIVGDESSVSANVAAQVAPFAGEVVRLGGADRFETSQLIAEYAFDSASTAYIATGLNFPDALTAGAAAGADAAPLLLTYGATPPAGLVDTLEGLGVDGVYIAGDGNAVATSQEDAFEDAGIEILDRYAGANRFDTGVQVSQASFDGPADRIYVATGLRFPDALAGSAIAGAQGVPVFTTRPTCMWADVLTERDRLGGPQVVLLGDQLALDNNVFDLEACTS